MIKEWLKIKLIYIKGIIIAYLKKEIIKTTKEKQAFVMLAANYNNLGDIAITKAQEEFLINSLSDDYEIIVVPFDKTYHVFFSMKKMINKDTIITLIGGGNSGTLYEFIEGPRRFILKHFNNDKIISFPQSVYYGMEGNTKIYKQEFERLCNKCTNLTLFAREQQSYNRYKSMVNETINVLLLPDIVFSLENVERGGKREGVGLIFRKDKEKLISGMTENKLINECKKQFRNLEFCDTCDVNVSGNGYNELDLFVTEIKTKELIITDRLHGMILAYITETPCIVFDNNNHKIKSTYETWLQNDSGIHFLKEASEIGDIKKIVYNKNISGRHFLICKSFELLKKIIDA